MDQTDASVELRWPQLADHHLAALQNAVGWILAHYAVRGIFACGSIIRGNPGPSSDFDIYVIHAAPQRQRVQRRFDGVPAEIFVNPPAAVRSYFVAEHAAFRPITAHMLSQGFVVLDRDPVVQTLRDEAATWLAQAPPAWSDGQRIMARYLAADQLDNARDLLDTDPENAELLLHDAVRATVDILFKANGRYLPRGKEFITAATHLDATAGDLLRALYHTRDLAERFRLADELGRHVLDASGFFEWASQPELFPLEEKTEIGD